MVELYERYKLKGGIEQGIDLGEEKLAKLIDILLKNKKEGEILLVTKDKDVRKDYYKKYGVV